MLHKKIFKIRIFSLAKNDFQKQNSLTFPWRLEICRKFPDILGRFSDIQRSISNSLTFQVFQIFQVSGNPVKKMEYLISGKTTLIH